MQRSTNPRFTRTRRRALSVPFVITIAATGAACGADREERPAGDRPATTDAAVTSNPAEPEETIVISNPAEPEETIVVSNPAEPEETIVVSNPAPPADG